MWKPTRSNAPDGDGRLSWLAALFVADTIRQKKPIGDWRSQGGRSHLLRLLWRGRVCYKISSVLYNPGTPQQVGPVFFLRQEGAVDQVVPQKKCFWDSQRRAAIAPAAILASLLVII